MSTKPTPITTPPDKAEFERRLGKVQGLMKERGLDFYLSFSVENIYYLTRFGYIPWERPFFLLIPQSGEPEMVVPLLELSHAVECSPYRKIHAYTEYPAPPGKGYQELMAGLIPSGARVGVEPTLPIGLKDCVRGSIVVSDVIEEARVVKTEYEVGRICYAAKITSLGVKTALDMSKEGVSALAFQSSMSRATMGAVYSDIPAANPFLTNNFSGVWIGPRSIQPHASTPPDETMQKHIPNITMCLVQADGYGCECERTFFLGKPEPWAAETFKVVMEARELGFSLVKNGAACSEIDDKVLTYLEKKGYGEQILHRTAHGFGITVHERPWLARGSKDVLRENMVISMEPGLYFAGKGGFRHSDTVLVTKNGYEILTEFPTDLESLTLPG